MSDDVKGMMVATTDPGIRALERLLHHLAAADANAPLNRALLLLAISNTLTAMRKECGPAPAESGSRHLLPDEAGAGAADYRTHRYYHELLAIADTIERNGGWHIAAVKVRGAAEDINRMQLLLREVIDLVQLGDINEDRPAHGWREWLKRAQAALAFLA